ncbi:Vitamin B12-binding protein [uncultured archaeon]|nr:Vitamin B12-binding protein [uncultured archaeon]
MKNRLRNGFLILIILAAINFVHGAVPGDLNGDNIVSQDELQNAENLLKEGKITSDQLDEIKHIKENYPRTIVDINNRTVTIYKPINRIIAFGGYDAELIDLLGDDEKVVGVASWFKDNDFRRLCLPSLVKRPAPGDAKTPDYEAIVNLNPDAVMCWHYYTINLAEQLPSNITVIGIDLIDPAHYIDEARKLAYLLEREGRLDQYIENYYSKYIDLISARSKGLAENDRPKVYWEFPSAYSTVGKKSSSTSRIEMCGGRNIFADSDFDTSTVDAEEVVKRNPDIIISLVSTKIPGLGYSVDDMAKAKALRDSIMQRPELANVTAVKNGHVYLMSSGCNTGLQQPVALAFMAKMLQPKLYKDLDPLSIDEELMNDYLNVSFDVRNHGTLVYPLPEES